MIDFAHSDAALLAPVALVVDRLHSECGVDSERILLVGAICRNMLHTAYGYEFAVADTRDIDLGLILEDWGEYRRVVDVYPAVGDTGIRFLIAGLVVDVLPFGGVENPLGSATPEGRNQPLDVSGFENVYEHAALVRLPGTDNQIRIPQPAGYAALKMFAWLDRSAYGEYKDARDLALAMYWYLESEDVADRLYGGDEGVRLLEAAEWDRDVAAVKMLSGEIRSQLGEIAPVLGERWRRADTALIARSLSLPPGINWTTDRARRSRLAAELAFELG
ncbi:hypothetical protein [Microbacterium sp.]|uniref:hypothetical protein n=1 Tax=Microbacterium sp. TaxID=51671 RepID=UPI003C70717B